MLFADNISVVAQKGETDECVRVTKEGISKWNERNNEDKKSVELGREQSEDVRILSSWVGNKSDVRNRIRRGGWIWSTVKGWLTVSLLSIRRQASVVEGCVESSVLYDCHARVWYKRELKGLGKCHRYVWSDRKDEPLRQMSERRVNMVDIRERLGVKSVAWKVEKRGLNRIEYMLRMGNERLMKGIVIGLYEGLESRSKMIGKKKTVLYWKRVLREAWVEYEGSGASGG